MNKNGFKIVIIDIFLLKFSILKTERTKVECDMNNGSAK